MPACNCFDFPVSWDFYRAHCIEFHNFDPGSNYPPEEVEPEPRPIVRKHFHQEINNESLKLARRVTELERANKYLLNTLKERSLTKKDKV